MTVRIWFNGEWRHVQFRDLGIGFASNRLRWKVFRLESEGPPELARTWLTPAGRS